MNRKKLTFQQKKVEKFLYRIDIRTDVPNLCCYRRITFQNIFNFPNGRKNGCMIPVFKLFSYFFQRQIGQRSHEIHSNLPGFCR